MDALQFIALVGLIFAGFAVGAGVADMVDAHRRRTRGVAQWDRFIKAMEARETEGSRPAPVYTPPRRISDPSPKPRPE